jgi:photosystem II stability/assembly factor-like uncharacterized protein
MNKSSTIKKTSVSADAKDFLCGNTWKRRKIADKIVDEKVIALRAVAFGSNTFVAVGENGVVFTSNDGKTWKRRDSGYNYKDHIHLYGVAYGGGSTFVAVGKNQLIIRSTDKGKSWETINKPGGSPNFWKVAYGNGMYVAIGYTGGIWKSTDGKNWEEIKKLQEMALRNIAFGNGKFLVGARSKDGGRGYVSTDGVSWSKSFNIGTSCSGLCYYNGLWIATGHQICTSKDGKNWETLVDLKKAGRKENLYSCVGAPQSFIVGGDSGVVFNSPDGSEWKERNSKTKRLLLAMAYGQDIVVAVGTSKPEDPYCTHYSLVDGGPSITITSPSGGEKWEVGSLQEITWDKSDVAGNVKLEYSIDNGENWLALSNREKNDGKFYWTVFDTPSDKCKIKITDLKNGISGISKGTFSIMEEPSKIITVPVGKNTISEAIKRLEPGVVVKLEVGTYTQTEPIILPPNVTRFAFRGEGMGSTIITCENCDGIQQGGDTKVHQCDISGMTFMAAGTETSFTGIKLDGSKSDLSSNPNIIIRDVGFEAGEENGCWDQAIHMKDALNPLIENVHVSGNGDMQGCGILLDDCVGATVSGGGLCLVEKAIDIRQCKGVKVTNVSISNVNKGILIRKKSLHVMINNCIIDLVKRYAVNEREAESAGYHVISGGYYGFADDVTEIAYLIRLRNDGTVVNGIIADGNGNGDNAGKRNGLRIVPKDSPEELPVNMIKVIGCLFRNFETGVYLQGKECIISGNTFESTVNKGIDGTEGWQINNKIAGNTGLD